MTNRHAHDPYVICPKCSHQIPLTESLAAPLLEAERKAFRDQLTAKDAEFFKKQEELRKEKEELNRARDAIEDQIKQRLQTERTQIVATEAKAAREAVAADLAASGAELAELRAALKQNSTKLAEAQASQAEALRKQRELDDQKRELEVTIEKRVQASQAQIIAKARQDAEDTLKMQVSQKDAQIESMSRTIEELKRKADQGSQQTQGEALELELEALLRNRFPLDLVEPVGKGEFGGDIVQRVNAQLGAPAGVILWELKQTKNWADAWLAKLRDDQRHAKADVALIISQTLPKNVENFDLIDGVWVAHPRCAIPVAVALRHSLIELAGSRNAQVGQQSKMEQIYHYLTGPRFRQRLEGIVEKFEELKEDLDKERKFMNRVWAKREGQIQGVIETTVGMYGDLQGIAGKSLPEIPSLDVPLLEGS
ncbi:DUF2130 domain-containing protein [Bradyrhizobium sp. SYSU BS000235]|uniref:DUF2130 domain-containing protein n=1 Tax=Bradyrhizobium sp. SYSU BS000235 TaxID=3411332 RepID=UPI003C73BD1E